MFIKKLCSLAGVFLTALVLILEKNAQAYAHLSPTPPASQVVTDTLEWPQPRFTERQNDRHQMVEEGIKENGVTDPKTLEAMRRVPRHLFVPSHLRTFAYRNTPLPIGQGQTISQPFIVAYMTQMLDLQAGEKVLEIGTGSGYQAAILSELTPHVYTIEIVKELAKQAKSRFKELGYKTIKTKVGDGYKGWEKYAPFDAIILTAAPEEIPQPLIQQLKPGGIMVTPIGNPDEPQTLVKVTKTQDGEIRKTRVLPVRFVPMTGEAQQKN